MKVILLEKSSSGELVTIDAREWNGEMVAALEHVNYLSIHNQEYQTLEGKLNVDTGQLELLVMKVANDKS